MSTSAPPQSRTLAVLMHGTRLGELEQLRDRTVRLRYDPAYAGNESAIRLSVSLPTALRRHQDRVVGPWLANLLPERPETQARWRARFGVRDPTPYGLLTHVGLDVAGAVQFVRPDLIAQASAAGDVRWLTDREVATLLSDALTEQDEWLPAAGTGQFSLAGAQAKIALHQAGGRWGIPTGRTPTTHIVKPAIERLPDQDIGEHLTMSAAALAGLPVARTTLAEFAGRRALVVTRFDRFQREGAWLRVHQEDLCQALGYPPERKYQSLRGPSVREIGQLLATELLPARSVLDRLRFADALIFNWIVLGTDAHAKNYALLLAPGNATRLAPLYDLNSYLPWLRDTHRPQLSMSIGGITTDPDGVGPHEWESAARDLNLDPSAVLDRVRHLLDVVPDAMAEAAGQADVTPWRSPLPARLTDLVAARARALRPLAGFRRP